MHLIPLPDSIYSEVERAAEARGLTVERFFQEAVQLHLTEELHEPKPLRLTDEQASLVRQAQADVRAGNFLTMEQVEERHAANRAAWLKANPV